MLLGIILAQIGITMARVSLNNPEVEFTVTMTLSESQARALSVLASYSADSFVKYISEYIADSYMQKHGEGFRSLLDSIRHELPRLLEKVDDARQALKPDSMDVYVSE